MQQQARDPTAVAIGPPELSPSRWSILAACALVSAGNLIRPPLYQLLPPFPEQAFGAAWSRFWNISATSTILLVTFVLAGGVLGDLYGRRRVMLLGAGGFVAAISLCAMAQSLAWYIAASAMAGICAALCLPLAVAVIRLSFPERDLAWAFAAYTVFTGAATLGASVLSGPIKGLFGWRAMFGPAIVLGGAGLLMALRYVPESRDHGSYKPIDAIGIAAWSGLILALVFGLLQVRVAGLSASVGWSSLGVAAVGALALGYWEYRTPGPVLRDPPFPRYILSIIIITALTMSFALLGFALQLYNFLRTAKLYGPVLAGVALAPLVVGMLLGALAAARQLGRRPAPRLIAIGMALMLLATLLTAAATLLMHARAPYLLILLGLTVFGAGHALALTAWQTMYMSAMPRGLAGLSAAVSNAAGQLGGVIAGTALAAFLADLGGRDFARRLEARGLAPELIDQARAALDRALQPEALADPAVASHEITTALLEVYRESYAVAVGGVLLAVAGLVMLCVALVWFGLRPGLVRSLSSSPRTTG